MGMSVHVMNKEKRNRGPGHRSSSSAQERAGENCGDLSAAVGPKGNSSRGRVCLSCRTIPTTMPQMRTATRGSSSGPPPFFLSLSFPTMTHSLTHLLRHSFADTPPHHDRQHTPCPSPHDSDPMQASYAADLSVPQLNQSTLSSPNSFVTHHHSSFINPSQHTYRARDDSSWPLSPPLTTLAATLSAPKLNPRGECE